MGTIDLTIFLVYFLGVLGIGVYFYLKNKSKEDYYVGSRKISPAHIGMSIVATDVGGGFSVGLGGLGFIMGLSASWLLFSGLLGAWLAAVLIVPRIKALDMQNEFYTFPDFLKLKYGADVALVASVISGIGYLGFTAAQILAGAKLAAGSVLSDVTFCDPQKLALYVMAGIVLLYTVLGGLKAVIYTDTIQWIILLLGLLLFGIPFAYFKVGGLSQLTSQLPSEFFSLLNITPARMINWLFTIVPIWFIAMTLYQRIYASRDVKSAQKAFYIAGLLEYPIMAFSGVVLGMIARIFYPNVDAEMGMPMLLKNVLPVGVMGMVLAAYFSAIMSTADSCLIASSGNFVNDILENYFFKNPGIKKSIRVSQIVTLIIGGLALMLAAAFQTVLELILHAYAFMVAGLFVPTIAAYFIPNANPNAAKLAMLAGGGFTLTAILLTLELPFELDASVYGIFISLFVFIIVSIFKKQEVIVHARQD